MSYIIAVAVHKICETHTFDRYLLSIADLAKNHFLACGNAKKRELDNNFTLLETCVLKKKINKSWSPKTADNIYKNYLPKVTQ